MLKSFRFIIGVPLMVALLLNAPIVSAQGQAGKPKAVFACAIGNKSLSITSVGSTLIYRFGTSEKVEMSIVASPQSRTAYWMTQRYAGMEYQLRFKNGDYSYIAYSMEGNNRTGIRPVSGLVVMQGQKRLADRPCTKYAEFSTFYDYDSLPEDSEMYSAM